jgi:hypothetical protein
VFENRVLRRIFGTKRDEETGGWRKPHDNYLHKFYCVPNIMKACSTNGGDDKCVRKFGKGPFGRQRRRLEYNIKMYIQGRRLEGEDWIHLAQDGNVGGLL